MARQGKGEREMDGQRARRRREKRMKREMRRTKDNGKVSREKRR